MPHMQIAVGMQYGLGAEISLNSDLDSDYPVLCIFYIFETTENDAIYASATPSWV